MEHSTSSNKQKINENEINNEALRVKSKKPKRRDKTDLGPDFVAPDGGWGWVVCLAAGFSSFCIYTPVQQYGIIYRQRMYDLGFDAKQVTTIINSELAIAALTGITNGALFRRFTFRQTAFAGGLLVSVGILLTAYCRAFWQYFLCFSCLYGIGLGMNLSATALAVNTYFKNNRRRAMGFSTTITGLGPIILPYVCTLLLQVYGTQGTIILVAAFSLNTLFCAATLQPVQWHVKRKRSRQNGVEEEKFEEVTLLPKCQFCMDKEKNALNKLNDDEVRNSKNGVTPAPLSDKRNGSDNDEAKPQTQLSTEDKFKANASNDPPPQCTCEKTAPQRKNPSGQTNTKTENDLTFKEKFIKFFDLDLLADLTFVNLIQGITVMMFCELNFGFLTPFILASYGYNNQQISIAMSVMASVDILVRFTAPFALNKVKLSNKLLFAFGIVILLTGRIFVTMSNSFYSILGIFLFMGFGKGFRTIFVPLLIPSYVPLNRLPAASGLQLFFNAIFTMSVGPVLGFIADISSYTFTIHLMNLITILSLLLWLAEWVVRRIFNKSKEIISLS